jgi:hypothetical protein
MTIAKAKAPKQVGRYQLSYEVATSYLGPLWVARIEGNDPGLALLRLVSLARFDADTRVRLLEAAWQAMEVRDERVLSATDVVASDGELSVISEYVEGTPLRNFSGLVSVRRKPVPVPIALRFIVDLADAVLALHRAMAELGDEAVPLYGGLSADSVFVGANGHASLMDVAIASAASTVDSLGTSPERLAYAAPEQIGPGGAADARTDVFTLGVLAWELLSNRRLFAGADKAVAQRVLSAKIARPGEGLRKGETEIPKALVDVVMCALERDPTARFESVEAWRTALAGTKLTPGTPEEAGAYVVSIADGAFARAREALSLPPRPRPEPVATGPRFRASLQTPATGARLSGTPVSPDAATPRAMPARPAPVRTGAESAPRPRGSTLEAPRAAPVGAPRAVIVDAMTVDAAPVEAPRTAPVEAPPTVPVEAPPIEAPRAGVPEAQPSMNPPANLGWRALEPQASGRSVPPANARSVPPAKVRPRQTTMIGVPPPADSRSVRPGAPPATAVKVAATMPVTAHPDPAAPPVAAPPAEAALPVMDPRARAAPDPAFASTPIAAPAPLVAAQAAPPAAITSTEPPPSSDEPTAQYSREHLRQLAASPPPLSEAPLPMQVVPSPGPSLFPKRESQAPLSRLSPHQPTPRPLSEIHTERPPPPEPDADPAPAFRVAAPLPPADFNAPPAHVAAAPLPARLEAPAQVGPAGSSIAPPRERSLSRRADSAAPAGMRSNELPPFSRPPPATAQPSYVPSQIGPPLVHDPRANRRPSLRAPQGLHFTRGVVLGVIVSLGLVATSTIVALFLMRRYAAEAAEPPRAAAAAQVPATPPETVAPPLPSALTPQTAPAASATPEVVPAADPVASATATADEAAETAPSGSAATAAPEAARAPARTAPRAGHTGKKSTKKRFIPSDI